MKHGSKKHTMGAPTHKATGVKTLGADAYGPQKPLGSMSLAKPSTPSQMDRSSSGRKRTSA